jgi:hypothetical protein
MTVYRANWFDTFRDLVQFYPKLSASIVFGSMAAVANMLPQRVNGAASGSVQAATEPLIASIAPRKTPKKRAMAHRPMRKARKLSKRVHGRRKAV